MKTVTVDDETHQIIKLCATKNNTTIREFLEGKLTQEEKELLKRL